MMIWFPLISLRRREQSEITALWFLLHHTRLLLLLLLHIYNMKGLRVKGLLACAALCCVACSFHHAERGVVF